MLKAETAVYTGLILCECIDGCKEGSGAVCLKETGAMIYAYT